MRVFLMAAIPLVIVELETGGVFDWKPILIAGVIAVLRFTDKLLHKRAMAMPKKERPKGYLGVKGLTGF